MAGRNKHAMKILETRNRKGIKWRRYRGAMGERIVTLEIPEMVVRELTRRCDLVQAMIEYNTKNELIRWKHDQLKKEEMQ